MEIEYNGEMVEAYDLVISRKIAEQIIKGERTIVTRPMNLFYQNKFVNLENAPKVEKGELGFQDFYNQIWFAHFHDYGTFSLDVYIDEIGFSFLAEEDVKEMNEAFDFHDFDNEWQKYIDRPGKEPGYYYLHIDEVIRQSDDNERVWKKRSRY